MKPSLKSGVLKRIGATGLVLMLSLCLACHGKRSLTLPSELSGVWATDDPRYRGRLLELWPTFIIIITGPENPVSVQWVDKVETQPRGDEAAFTVYSTDYSQRQDYQMVLRFSSANGGELRCGNEPQVWRRLAAKTK